MGRNPKPEGALVQGSYRLRQDQIDKITKLAKRLKQDASVIHREALDAGLVVLEAKKGKR